MTPAYTLTADAEADLRSIIRYTSAQWGPQQVRTYVSKLERAIDRVATGQGRWKNLTDVNPDLKLARCERHYIFCLSRENAPALIIAIFHERMDLVARVSERLDPPSESID